MEWWEKTIEYLFVVREFKHRERALIAPLSGVQERRFGDAILDLGGKLLLIEFKRDVTAIAKESKKFLATQAPGADFRTAPEHRAASGLPGAACHFLVYGHAPRDDALDLRFERYWNATVSGPASLSSIEALAPDAVGIAIQTQLDDYLKAFLLLRKPDARGDGSDASGVIAIAPDGAVETIDLSDYLAERPELRPKSSADIGPRPRPAFG